MLVSIIGVDLAGKTTQVAKLVEYYRKYNLSVESVSLTEKPTVNNVLSLSYKKFGYPTNFPFGLDPNYYAIAYFCDFLNHYFNNIIPLLDNPIDLIISDRYVDCYKAYSYAVGATSIFINTFFNNLLYEPDLQFCLDLEFDEVKKRINNCGRSRELDECDEMLIKYIKYYRYLCKNKPSIIKIEASKTIIEITEQLIESIDIKMKALLIKSKTGENLL